MLQAPLLISAAAHAAPNAYNVESEMLYASDEAAPKATPLDCTWPNDLVQSISRLSSAPAAPNTERAITPRAVRLKVTQQGAPATGTKGSVEAAIRASIQVQGKLVARQDFDVSKKITASMSACEGFAALSKELADSVDEWVRDAVLPQCGEDCLGIHPDDPIYLSDNILEEDEFSVSDTVRNECKWQQYMPSLIKKEYDEERSVNAPALIVQKNHAKSTKSRTLVLLVRNIHVAGFGANSGPKWINMQDSYSIEIC